MKKKALYVDPGIVIGERKEAVDLQILAQVSEDLESYCGLPMKTLARNWWAHREKTHHEEERILQSAQNQKSILDFYAETDYYLYECTYWEAQKDKQREYRKIWLACTKWGLKKLLDFGGGTGGGTLYFHRRGMACDYLDVPGKTSAFAEWRFSKRGLSVAIHPPDPSQLPANHYDGIIAYDVLEHLFDVPAAVRPIARSLKPGGLLFAKSTFGGGGAHLHQNERYEDVRTFSQLCSEQGLRFLGQLKTDRFSQALRHVGLRYVAFKIRIVPRMKSGGNFLLYQKR